ncbi:MAG: hypothetical protein IMX00_01075 [Limnochordales bacterium]|nr:hypothetical protein [Limnochordales bacterium]
MRRSALTAFQSMFPRRSAIYHALGMMDGVVSPETFFVNASQVTSIINNVVRNEIAMNKKPVKQALAEIADAIRALYRNK